MDTQFTLVFAAYTMTTAHIAYYRGATGLVTGATGTIATKASGAIGSTTAKPTSGGAASTGATTLLVDVLTTALNHAQMAEIGAKASRLMKSIGKTL